MRRLAASTLIAASAVLAGCDNTISTSKPGSDGVSKSDQSQARVGVVEPKSTPHDKKNVAESPGATLQQQPNEPVADAARAPPSSPQASSTPPASPPSAIAPPGETSRERSSIGAGSGDGEQSRTAEPANALSRDAQAPTDDPFSTTGPVPGSPGYYTRSPLDPNRAPPVALPPDALIEGRRVAGVTPKAAPAQEPSMSRFENRVLDAGMVSLLLKADRTFVMRSTRTNQQIEGRYAIEGDTVTFSEARGDTGGASFPMQCRFEQAGDGVQLERIGNNCTHFEGLTFR